MANFIPVRSGTTEFMVNVDSIDYVQADGTKCSIYFGKEHAISVDHSAYEVVSKVVLDPSKMRSEEASRRFVEMNPEDRKLL